MSFYNEHDPFAARWLQNLSNAGHIAKGQIDGRSIQEIQPSDISEGQAHFFAGIGVWSYALRRAGWPDDLPVWTGSCPCQPFSSAGKRGGFQDERHLWPEWFRLIRECRPPVIFGEQVASPDGLKWFDIVSSDLERAGYAVGAADISAAGVGAPHIRQRLYFVAYSENTGWEQRNGKQSISHLGWSGPERQDAPRILGDASRSGLEERQEQEKQRGNIREERSTFTEAVLRGPWANAEWLPCRDGKFRPVESGTFPLAHGAPSRVGRLRAYGNALCTETAATFITAAVDAVREE